jgi:hypothetical protein
LKLPTREETVFRKKSAEDIIAISVIAWRE